MSNVRTNAIKQIREDKKLTLRELSDITGISTSDICQVELGNKRCFPNWRKKLSEALGKHESELFPVYKEV